MTESAAHTVHTPGICPESVLQIMSLPGDETLGGPCGPGDHYRSHWKSLHTRPHDSSAVGV